jgi:hypothetical protein
MGSKIYMSKKITTQIEIDASVQDVWDILINFKDYSSWNPFIKHISGAASKGKRLKVIVHPEGGKAMTFTPTILKADEPTELRWLGKLLFSALFEGEHSFILEPLENNRTRLTHSESFKGLLVPIFWKTLDTGTRAGFEAMNQALKIEAEKHKNKKTIA